MTVPHSVAVQPDAPCAHCGLPVGSHPVGDDPYFCCTGCVIVYDALNSAGYGETFYQLRDLTPDRKAVKPAQVKVDALRVSELDTEAFLEEHTQHLTNGNRSVELFLDGVHCAACVWLVERMPFEVSGVKRTRLDLPRARLTLDFDPDAIRLSEVAEWLARFGYIAYPARQEGVNQRTATERRLLIKMGICWALAGNVMLFAFALYSGLDQASDTSLLTGARWASFILAIVSVGYGGSEFFRKAWASIKVSWQAGSLRHLHMDTPISLGILVGFGHSAWATITGKGDVWFDSITVLIAALLTARWLQLRSRRLAGDASERLLALIPSMARRIARAGDESPPNEFEMVRASMLQVGDLVEVPAGEVFPVDGVVVAGSSTVDKAVLTGESRPEKLEMGMKIEAGATNLRASVRVKVEAAGDETRVGKLLAWIRDEASRQAPVVLLADRLSGYFVGGLLTLAALTAIGWMMVDASAVAPHVVALLVISCPCALGMATPLAMAIAAGRAARKGIFIKSDEATQQLTEVNVVALDKTGTLTEGRMTLINWAGDESALDLAAALESQSNHPIAQALIKARGVCTIDGAPVDDQPDVTLFESIAGSGVAGYVNGLHVAAGKPDWVVNESISDATLEAVLNDYAKAGYTPVAVAVEGRLVAALAIGDRIRAEAKDMVEQLSASGKDIYLISGDHEAVVQHVAEVLGIPPSHAMGGVSPEDKKVFVDTLRTKPGRVIAMVGDGVNDAVALQAADVGIAVQGGSAPSLVAADVFLTRDGLAPITDALTGAHQVMRVVKRNLGISLVYNIIGASAAILGLVTPFVAAVAMPVSSLIVVASSIMQRSFIR